MERNRRCIRRDGRRWRKRSPGGGGECRNRRGHVSGAGGKRGRFGRRGIGADSGDLVRVSHGNQARPGRGCRVALLHHVDAPGPDARRRDGQSEAEEEENGWRKVAQSCRRAKKGSLGREDILPPREPLRWEELSPTERQRRRQLQPILFPLHNEASTTARRGLRFCAKLFPRQLVPRLGSSGSQYLWLIPSSRILPR